MVLSMHQTVILTHEFNDIYKDVKKSKKLSHALMYIFGPPGWSHDGSTLTVKQQQRLFKQHKDVNPELVYSRPN